MDEWMDEQAHYKLTHMQTYLGALEFAGVIWFESVTWPANSYCYLLILIAIIIAYFYDGHFVVAFSLTAAAVLGCFPLREKERKILLQKE
ncbi:unnamed protein product [Ceratitis capitata]|uniref:(Mediterranean fruit fly) hypothetical protein n=1 Tax=Ceratitis capitata TaxID=7213 RepID=A0A811V2I8_CERCA|nr:unnamed protein product [Ceratitis capitata]